MSAEVPKIIRTQRKNAIIYVLNMTLQCSDPIVRRKVHLPSDSTFFNLHNVIMKIMKWKNVHMHCSQGAGKFENVFIADVQCSVGVTGEVRLDESKVELRDYFKNVGDMFCYNYDYGKGWKVEIEQENIKDSDPDVLYPICIAGENAGPPEDLSKPRDEWPFDYREFDPTTAMD